MLKYTNSDIVFQEIPDEITLAINLSGCPCHCPGCHSKQLWRDEGEPLTEETIERMLATMPAGISCVALMGGDACPAEINSIASTLKARHPMLKTAWYSGRSTLSDRVSLDNLDYLKLGPYLAHLGSLKSPRTNQRLYRVEHCSDNGTTGKAKKNYRLKDLTPRFWERP